MKRLKKQNYLKKSMSLVGVTLEDLSSINVLPMMLEYVGTM